MISNNNNDRPPACPERLWNCFSMVMEMRLNFSLVANTRVEGIQSKIKQLFNIDIEDEIAHEFYLLMYAITVNDSFYGYSKHNYTGAKIIANNKAELSNVPEIQQALVKNERAKQFKVNKDSESNLLETISQVIDVYNRLIEGCLDIAREKSEEVQNSTDEIDLGNDIVFPDFLELQIKVTTNFQTVARKLNKHSKTEIPEAEVFSIKVKDGVESELILAAIKEKVYEKKIQGPYHDQFMVPKVDKPYHALVGALHNFMEAVLPDNSKTRNKQFVNWILGESGILISEALFYTIETHTKSTSYGDYKDYLKSVDPNRDR